jgi:hypothetical protein
MTAFENSITFEMLNVEIGDVSLSNLQQINYTSAITVMQFRLIIIIAFVDYINAPKQLICWLCIQQSL